MILQPHRVGNFIYRVARSQSRYASNEPGKTSIVVKNGKGSFEAGQLFSSPDTLHSKANEIIVHRQRVYREEIPVESLLHKFFRWCDIGGHFSRWNNRQYWCLTAPPLLRIEAIMMTEYERKVFLFREYNSQIFLVLTVAAMLVFYHYRSTRQPLPQVVGLEAPFRATMGYFSVLPFMYPKKRCPHCRLYDPECKVGVVLDQIYSSFWFLFSDFF